MNKNKKKKNNIKDVLIVIIPIGIIALVAAILTIVCIKESNKIGIYFEGESISAIPSYINNQYEINQHLMTIANDKQYTYNNAYVELNPYKISPLSAIIIFQTKTKEAVKVSINGEEFTTTEASKKHIIPIYGLYEDTTNVVKLELGNKTSSYTIKTSPSNIKYPLTVEYASKELTKNDIYFTVASLETWLTGWDKDGKLRFYLTVDNRMDVEWLENGHFLIGVTQDQTREQFVGFVEMDYLGKVYNYYTLQNGYSFEFQPLTNGNLMLAGGEQAIYMNQQVVYELDLNTGDKVSEINIYDVVKKIDPEFSDKYLGASAIRNGFYYDENTKELLVSFRDISTIWSFNYETKELNWVFTDQADTLFKNPVWKDYLIKVNRGRYPQAQHTPQILNDGKIAFFNNGYDRYGTSVLGKSDSVTDMSRNYSAAEVYEIKNRKANLVWSYNNNKDWFSIKYGLFRVNDDNHKLMNFGYILTDEYRSNSDNKVKDSESLPESMYAYEIELDENNKIYFKAKCEEGKYRLFKYTLYNEETKNTEVSKLTFFDKVNKDELTETSYKKVNFANSSEWIYSLELTNNTLTTNYDIAENDDIDLYFLNKSGKVFILNYKDKDNTQKKRVFGSKLKGTYAVFIKINDTLYNTNKVYEF